MKKNLFILCTLAVQLLFFSTVSADNKAIMKVIVKQPDLTKSINLDRFTGNLSRKNIHLSFKDNKAQLSKMPNTDIEIGRIINKNSIHYFYLSDKAFSITIDKENYSFEGEGAKAQIHLNEFMKKTFETHIILNINNILEMTYKEYDQLIQKNKKEVQTLIATVGTYDQKLQQWMQTSLDVTIFYNKVFYLSFFENKELQEHILKNFSSLKLKAQKIPLNFITKEKFNLNEKYLGISTDDIELLLSGIFSSIATLDKTRQKEILTHIQITKGFKDLNTKNSSNLNLYIDILNNINNPETYTNFAMMSYMKYGGIDKNWTDYLNTIGNHLRNKEDFKILQNLYLKRKNNKKLAQNINNQPAGTFVCKDINGKEVRLSDFKGKYIFLDIWATWCGPCKGELPSLAKQEEKFKDENVVFMSISIDQKEETWSSFVKEKKLKGVQVIAGDAKKEITKLYSIRGIPRFILLGKDGKVLNGDFLRPSNKNFDKALNAYLKK